MGVLIALCLALLVALITPWAVPTLLGRAFESAVSPALILVGASVIAATNLTLEEGLCALGTPRP
jgi:O-antigen/teichoic acid export membrane protein